MIQNWLLVSSIVVIALNGLWFTAAFRLFSLQHDGATRVLFVRDADRGSPLVDSLAALLRFLGGMNAALAVLCWAVVALAVAGSSLFGDRGEMVVILVVLGVANFTQFWFNVPVLRARRVDPGALWPVKTGLMRQIFVGDASLVMINVGMAVLVATQL